MKRVNKAKPRKTSKGAPKKGDVYTVNVDVEAATDVDGDGVNDLSVTTEALRNGELFQTTTCVWYGLDPAALAAFENILATHGISDQTITGSFKDLVGIWKDQIQALREVNKYGDDVAALLTE